MNLGELRSTFMTELNRRDVTKSQIDAWISRSIQRAQRLIRTPASETTIAFDVSDTSAEIAIPSDYIKMVSLICDGDELVLTDLKTVLRYSRHLGHPRFYARSGGSFLLGPAPCDGHTVYLTYLANIPDLQVDTDSNWLSELAPDIIIYGAMRFAMMTFQDVRADMYEGEFIKAIADLNNMAREDELINGAIAPSYSFGFDDL